MPRSPKGERPAGRTPRLRIGRDHTLENADRGRQMFASRRRWQFPLNTKHRFISSQVGINLS